MLVADEVWRLQRQFDPARANDDPECVFFARFAARGHYGDANGTKQGLYCVTPGGRLLGALNDNRAEVVAAALHDALEVWDKLDASIRAEVAPSGGIAPRFRPEWSCPVGGLLLEVWKRPLEVDVDAETLLAGGTAGAEALGAAWARDVAWLTDEEAAQLLAPEVPPALVSRLARCHLHSAGLHGGDAKGRSFPAAAIRCAELCGRRGRREDGAAVVGQQHLTTATHCPAKQAQVVVMSLKALAMHEQP